MIKVKFTLVIIFFLIFFTSVFSQDDIKSSVKGVIIDEATKQPLESATIQVFNSADSSLINGTLSDKEGKFEITGIPQGKVYIRISYIGYTNAVAKNIQTGKSNPLINLSTVNLKPTGETTAEIEVSTEAPVMTFEAGKKVYDAKKDLTAQTGNTLDLLKNIPSVEVDNDGNVSMRGTGNVKILIDGKQSALLSNGTQVLQTIPANLIEKVEIITNPSAKYESEGVSGIINIIMKENDELGYNGNLKINGGSQDKYNISMGGSYKKNKLTLNGNYSYWNYSIPGVTQVNRTTFANYNTYSVEQNLNWRYKGISNFGSAGLDYDFDKYNTLSLVSNFIIYTRNLNNNGSLKFFDPLSQPTADYKGKNYEDRYGHNLDLTLTYSKRFLQKGKDWTTFINYSSRFDKNDAVNELYSVNQNSRDDIKNNYRFNLLNFQSDYVLPFDEKETYKLEAGLKSNARFIKGDYLYQTYDFINNYWVNVPDKLNNADYKDLISAAYLNFSGLYKDFSYQGGIRAEHTYINFEIQNGSQKFDNKYFDFFPSISLSQKIGNTNQFQASYSRRINRPNMFMLNPFTDYIDQFTTRSGNPYLNPEYINSAEIGYTRYFGFITTTLNGYLRNLNNQITFTSTVDTNGVAFLRPENKGKVNTYGAELILQGGFAKWWTYNTSFSYYNSNVIDNSNGNNFDASYNAWNIRFNTNASIPDLFDVQLMYFYNGKQITSQGDIAPFQMVNLAINKSFFNKKLILGLRLNDLFNQQRFRFNRADNQYLQTLYQKANSRSVFLSLTYNFGEQFKSQSGRNSQRKQREMENEIQQSN